MNAANLRAVKENNNEEAVVETVFQVKALDSQFTSFGDALFSWTNSMGFARPEAKQVNGEMVRAFCWALGLPFASTDASMITTSEHYFESDAWFFKYIEDRGFQRLGHGSFYLLDEYNRPIAYLDLETSLVQNISIEICGAEHLVVELLELTKANIKIDEKTEKKATYVEVVKGGRGNMLDMAGGGSLSMQTGRVNNTRVALPEYYPYLDGGIEALLQDFIQSEESVLILMGPAGTGKSSLVTAGIEALDLLPIYGKKADVVADKDFVNFVFKASDEYMAKIAGTAAKARSDLFKETLAIEREFFARRPLFEKKQEVETPKVPIIVVEDADLLLAPRSEGNLIMAELLNETDGVGSNHTRKIIFTTNLANTKGIDAALMRPGRCYEVVNCRLLTPDEAVAARRANGLPDFEVKPTSDISLAEALRKPRKKIVLTSGKATLGFGGAR